MKSTENSPQLLCGNSRALRWPTLTPHLEPTPRVTSFVMARPITDSHGGSRHAAAAALALAITTTITTALDNGLGLRPQRGYNSWYDVLMQPSEAGVLATAAALKANGLFALGFEYINLDDGMVASARAANGSLLPDPKFTHGFKWLSDTLHAEGMKFGVYTDRGTETCG